MYFSAQAWIEAAGANKTYQYTDRAVSYDTIYYYRLRQLDLDGSEAFSEIVQAVKQG